MRYVLAVLIGIVGLIFGWLVAAFGTLVLGSAFGLSDFEGARAMLAFFAIGPAKASDLKCDPHLGRSQRRI